MLAEATIDRIVSKYPHGTRFQRWHMRGRLHLCPYDALLKHLTGKGSILDIGCGFGHMAWLMEEMRPDLKYQGVDIDERKIALAQGCPSSPYRPEFLTGNILNMPDIVGPFGNIVILDVIYLLPWEVQVQMIEWCVGKLAPGTESALVIKTMDMAVGWVGWRTVAEEWIMVHLLRRTRSSGTINGIKSFTAYEDLISKLGFKCEIENLPTWNPSSIFRIHR
jgi:2-polyprenyl-3-methyl-5-hydroxy-6-metoxy-1,4-benzoquinol methylase